MVMSSMWLNNMLVISYTTLTNIFLVPQNSGGIHLSKLLKFKLKNVGTA